MELIIGSTAIKHYFPEFKRVPKDIDVAVLSARKREGEKEFLVNPVILKYQSEGFLSPTLMLSLKMSHMFYEFNWEKHMFDIQFLLGKGFKYDEKLIQELRALWEDILPKVRRSNLKSQKEDFFTNSINQDPHQHDFLHTLINPIPMYTLLLKKGCEVELDRGNWDRMSFEDREKVVREETTVMAAERYKTLPSKQAYIKQLKSCIMKHFPEYISLWAIENYIPLHIYKGNGIETIKNYLENEL